MDIGTLKKYVTRGWIEWRKHVFQRMLERGVSKSDVKKVLLEGELINSYDYDQPFPSALFFKKVNNRPLHVVAALDDNNRKVYIITAYEPSVDLFESDYKTRRKL